METPGENFEAPPNPSGGSEEENPSNNQFQNLLKNLLLILVLIALIIACFWVSFLLGKRILTPPKRPIPQNLPMVTSEALPSTDHLQKLAIEATKEGENIPITLEAVAKVKIATVKKIKVGKIVKKMPLFQLVTKEVKTIKWVPTTKPPAKKTVKPVAIKVTAKKVKGYYKVQVGFHTSRSSADSQAEKIQAAGFKSFIKKLPNGWRVQAGAFRTKAEANRFQATLKTYGFKSKVIYE